MRLAILLLLPALHAELIDRIAVSVGATVITESEILEHMRLRALLDDIPVRLDSDSKRDAADRLIQQTLIRREIETTHYAVPEAQLAQPLLTAFKLNRFNGDNVKYEAALKAARITETELLANFLWQLTVIRFIEFRFRPGIQVSADDIKAYYEGKFLTDWKAKSNDPPPSLENATNTVEEALVQERIDNELDRWISLTRTQVNIRYREEVFEGS